MRIQTIYQPKTKPSVSPPARVAGEIQTLPLYALGPKNFERLCARLASVQIGVLETWLYGTNGQNQQGIDVYARLEKSYTVYQAKCYETYAPSNIIEVVDVFLYKDKTTYATKRAQNTTPEKKWAVSGNMFILCVSCKLEETQYKDVIDAQRNRLAGFGIGFEVWDESRITNELRKHPEIILDYFGFEWVKLLFNNQDTYALYQDHIQTLVKIPEPLTSRLTPSNALRSNQRSVTFRFRRKEKALILKWLNEHDDYPVKVFTGKGGIGKTRLLLEMARMIQHCGWIAGFIEKELPKEKLDTIFSRNAPLFLIFDYAEGSHEQLNHLLNLLNQARAYPVRVVLLARDTGEWLYKLRLKSDKGNAIIDPNPIPIEPIRNELEIRQKTFQDAFLAYLKLFDGKHFEQRKTKPPNPPDLRAKAFELVLLIHMTALNMVLNPTENPSTNLETILDTLIDHETRYWEPIPATYNKEPLRMIDRLRRVMAVATLHGGFENERDTLNLVQKPPLLDNLNNSNGSTDDHISVLYHLKTLYPKEQAWIAPVEPDILGERLVQAELENENGNELINLVFGFPEPPIGTLTPEMESSFEVLMRMYKWAKIDEDKGMIHRRIIKERPNMCAGIEKQTVSKIIRKTPKDDNQWLKNIGIDIDSASRDL